MAEKEEVAGERNDWEVVSLTASAYAAAPGPRKVDLKDDDDKEAESSHPLYMSRHFVFPPSKHEDIATEPSDLTEIFGFSVEEGRKKDGDLTLKELNLSDEFAGVDFFVEKDKREESIYKTAMGSLQDERGIGGSHVYEQNEPIHEQTESLTPCAVPDVSPDLNPNKDEEAWWKRSLASLISQAKETNTVWSIFVAAAVMGIVILGQRWQQERWL